MSSEVSYTAEEIAKLLKISKLTVYDLIKRGELPSYRVGKQLRVDAEDLEAYKRRTRGTPRTEVRIDSSPSDLPAAPALPQTPVGGIRPIVITGQDISLDILTKHMEKRITGFRPLRSYVGSMDSLISMYRGESDIVSTHLLDGDTGEYNLPYVRKLFVGFSFLVVNLLSRNAGLYVRQGNPLGIRTWEDLGNPGLRLVNREKGSGARVLLDEQLRLHGIKPEQLDGYAFEQTNHLGVASKVASGEADVGVGIEKAALIVGQLDFIPLIRERYDLVVLKNRNTQPWLPALLEILRSDNFRKELGTIAGYDLTRTGEILFET
ncbi:helix-turn-helix domain-containing protein [Cohnella sp. CFH 77786]|uniref:helix-turn-helix transcriptional regulator n=1 Tax=Cohnella sp. CFH 77786 TaxID=2662265 RepID=UPI001C60A28E|nr:helix-turn-helix transcriptional regulator [Cohnella sp. CFH 77786]MBW5446335.1 helix-turn-helix domain-containing protein [Cohnella sp. CFH 77786]